MATTTMPRGASAAVADPLWAQAAELERQFEGYKRRLAERAAMAVAAADRPDAVGDVREDDRAGEEAETGRGRRYEAYVRRRDEKLRQGWLARMERKEAEVKALWARLDNTGGAGRRRGPDDAGVTASPAREQKPRSIEKPVPPATPRCTAAMKLPRLRSSASSSSLGSASPRLPSKTPRSTHPEAPATPRKENRMPPPSAAAAASPRPPKTLSRTRSSLKDSGKVERSSGSSSSSSSSSVRESPRPPRFQAPRAPAPSAAVAAAWSRFHEQVVLAEIMTAAVVSPEPSRLGRSRVGVAGASSPSLTPGQVDFLSRLGHNARDDREESKHSDAEGKNSNIEAGGNGDKPGNADVTGDSDTEPSYVYVKRDHEEAGDEQEAETFEETMASSSPSSETDTTVKESPAVIGAEASPRDSSESLYSNVQSSFSHGSELDASAAGSPLPTTPASGGALSTEELLESDAATLRMKREQEEVVEDQSIIFLPSTCCVARSGAVVPVAGRPQSPMEAVAGLKRFLTFGKKNGKGSDDAVVVVIERAPPSASVAAVSQRPASGDSTKPRMRGSDAAPDDPDNNNVMSPHVRSLQSFVASSPARSQPKEMAPPAKSPAVHRSFFSFSSFKNRGN
uniref:Uncharacterized protein n=1 Tax=Avena sativa TaxID=4498 RepID=A0ACD5ZKR6_AVESA